MFLKLRGPVNQARESGRLAAEKTRFNLLKSALEKKHGARRTTLKTLKMFERCQPQSGYTARHAILR